MAIALPGEDARNNAPSYEQQPFDVDLLCAKLELAKRELEAAARTRRKQQPDSSYDGQIFQRETGYDPPTRRPMTGVGDGPTWRSKTDPYPRTERKGRLHPKQLFSALKLGTSEDPSARQDVTKSNVARVDSRLPSLSRPRSSGNLIATELAHNTNKAHRMSTPRLNDYMYGTIERCQCQEASERSPRDAAERRSKTAPVLNSRPATSKHTSFATYERVDVLESPTQIYNGYVSSYDLSDRSDPDTGRGYRPKRASRSLMDLPALLKKDKAEVREEEVFDTTLEDAATTRWSHRRQKSLPAHLMNDPPPRIDDRAKRRLTFMGFIKLFQHPTIG